MIPGTFQRPLLWIALQVRGDLAREISPIGLKNKSKPMNDTQTGFQHPKPPKLVRVLVNSIVTAILRSPWHGLRSNRLLLLTFTGRKSGKEFTTPIRYEQDGETLRMKVLVEYQWWKNLRAEAKVHVLLRGKICTGIAEALPEEDGLVVVKVHLI